MKRILILALLLLASSGCTTTTQAPSTNAPVQTNANAQPTPTKSAAISEADIIAKEKQIWDALKNKDFDGFAAMIADDAVEVVSQGVNDKAAIVNEVKDLALTEVSLSDWKVVMVDKDAAIVTYTVSAKGTSGGQPVDSKPARASSAWVNRGGKWSAIYHQESEVAPPPAATSSPSPKSSTATTKTEASPAASASPASTSGDASEREKQVWDMLKRKDYDSFAAMLADDQVEVEPDGVYDKAGTINGVKQVDFTSASLSDFKVVKLDDDAALVTYLVKMTAQGSEPANERHSTIWANRNGKWLAVFHQGTPVKAQSK